MFNVCARVCGAGGDNTIGVSHKDGDHRPMLTIHGT